MLSQKKTNWNPLIHPIWKRHHTNLWIAKLLKSNWGFVAFFQTLKALKKASCVLSSVAVKRTVVMCGNWNVRQAMSQQVFRVTTFCFQSFSTVISRIVHHRRFFVGTQGRKQTAVKVRPIALPSLLTLNRTISLTVYLGFQFQASCGHEPHTRKICRS